MHPSIHLNPFATPSSGEVKEKCEREKTPKYPFPNQRAISSMLKRGYNKQTLFQSSCLMTTASRIEL
jgi:hypothetical protein